MGDDVSGKLQLDHGGDPGHVQSTARQVGAYQCGDGAIIIIILAVAIAIDIAITPEAIEVFRSLVQGHLGVILDRVDPALDEGLVDSLHVIDTVQKHHGFFSLQPIVVGTGIVFGQEHFGESLHSFFFGLHLVPFSGLGQSVVLGVVHVSRFDALGIRELSFQIGIDALQPHVRKGRRTKDVLRLLNGLLVRRSIRIDQLVGPTKADQDVLQRPDVSAVQQHVGFVYHQRLNIGKEVDELGGQSQWAKCRGRTHHNVHRRIAPAKADRVTEGLEVHGFFEPARHDRKAHNFRGIGVTRGLGVCQGCELVHETTTSLGPDHGFFDASTAEGNRHAQDLLD
mmetsp:Transcript_4504/g.10934  ORF Transcript_4504/g.10934 Transcript_4504/m.10934 type:complete len:339 (-) Transcript_4504:419-1435(-)